MSIKKLLSRIWNDPVGSKVISGIILSILGALAYIFLPLLKWLKFIYTSFITNPFVYLFVLSLLIIFILLKRNMKVIKINSPKKIIGMGWFANLSDDQFYRYLFLLWFPLHHSLQSEQLYEREKLDHIPEIHELFKAKILRKKYDSIAAITYVIEIDKGVYDYLDEFYQREKSSFDDRMWELIEVWRKSLFYDIWKIRNWNR